MSAKPSSSLITSIQDYLYVQSDFNCIPCDQWSIRYFCVFPFVGLKWFHHSININSLLDQYDDTSIDIKNEPTLLDYFVLSSKNGFLPCGWVVGGNIIIKSLYSNASITSYDIEIFSFTIELMCYQKEGTITLTLATDSDFRRNDWLHELFKLKTQQYFIFSAYQMKISPSCTLYDSCSVLTSTIQLDHVKTNSNVFQFLNQFLQLFQVQSSLEFPLSTLSFNDILLNENNIEAFSALLTYISTISISITSFECCNNRIETNNNPLIAWDIMKSLTYASTLFQNLTSLDLSNNLPFMFPKQRKLRDFEEQEREENDDNILAETYNVLVINIFKCKQLKSLNLSANNLSEAFGYVFGHILISFSSSLLQTVDLSNNKLGQSLAFICQVLLLKQHNHIRNVDISYNQMTSSTFNEIVKYLPDAYSLRLLSIKGCIDFDARSLTSLITNYFLHRQNFPLLKLEIKFGSNRYKEQIHVDSRDYKSAFTWLMSGMSTNIPNVILRSKWLEYLTYYNYVNNYNNVISNNNNSNLGINNRNNGRKSNNLAVITENIVINKHELIVHEHENDNDNIRSKFVNQNIQIIQHFLIICKKCIVTKNQNIDVNESDWMLRLTLALKCHPSQLQLLAVENGDCCTQVRYIIALFDVHDMIEYSTLIESSKMNRLPLARINEMLQNQSKLYNKTVTQIFEYLQNVLLPLDNSHTSEIPYRSNTLHELDILHVDMKSYDSINNQVFSTSTRLYQHDLEVFTDYVPLCSGESIFLTQFLLPTTSKNYQNQLYPTIEEDKYDHNSQLPDLQDILYNVQYDYDITKHNEQIRNINIDLLITCFRNLYKQKKIKKQIAMFWESSIYYFVVNVQDENEMLYDYEHSVMNYRYKMRYRSIIREMNCNNHLNVFPAPFHRIALYQAMFKRNKKEILFHIKKLRNCCSLGIVNGDINAILISYAEKLICELDALSSLGNKLKWLYEENCNDENYYHEDQLLIDIESYLLRCAQIGYTGIEAYKCIEIRSDLSNKIIRLSNELPNLIMCMNSRSTLTNLLLSRNWEELQDFIYDHANNNSSPSSLILLSDEFLISSQLLKHFNESIQKLQQFRMIPEIHLIDIEMLLVIMAYHNFSHEVIISNVFEDIVKYNNNVKQQLIDPLIENILEINETNQLQTIISKYHTCGWIHEDLIDMKLWELVFEEKLQLSCQFTLFDNIIKVTEIVKELKQTYYNKPELLKQELDKIISEQYERGIDNLHYIRMWRFISSRTFQIPENKELKEHVEIFKDIMKEKSAMLLLNDVEVYNLLQRNDIQGLTSLVLGQGRKPITLRIKSNTDYIRWSHSLLEVIVGMNSNKNKTKDVITKNVIIEGWLQMLPRDIHINTKTDLNKYQSQQYWKDQYFSLHDSMLWIYNDASKSIIKEILFLLGGKLIYLSDNDKQLDNQRDIFRYLQIKEGFDINSLDKDLYQSTISIIQDQQYLNLISQLITVTMKFHMKQIKIILQMIQKLNIDLSFYMNDYLIHMHENHQLATKLDIIRNKLDPLRLRFQITDNDIRFDVFISQIVKHLEDIEQKRINYFEQLPSIIVISTSSYSSAMISSSLSLESMMLQMRSSLYLQNWNVFKQTFSKLISTHLQLFQSSLSKSTSLSSRYNLAQILLAHMCYKVFRSRMDISDFSLSISSLKSNSTNDLCDDIVVGFASFDNMGNKLLSHVLSCCESFCYNFDELNLIRLLLSKQYSNHGNTISMSSSSITKITKNESDDDDDVDNVDSDLDLDSDQEYTKSDVANVSLLQYLDIRRYYRFLSPSYSIYQFPFSKRESKSSSSTSTSTMTSSWLTSTITHANRPTIHVPILSHGNHQSRLRFSVDLAKSLFENLKAILGEISLSQLHVNANSFGYSKNSKLFTSISVVVLDLIDTCRRHGGHAFTKCTFSITLADELYLQLCHKLGSYANVNIGVDIHVNTLKQQLQGWLLFSIYLHSFAMSRKLWFYLKNFIINLILKANKQQLQQPQPQQQEQPQTQLRKNKTNINEIESIKLVNLMNYCSKLLNSFNPKKKLEATQRDVNGLIIDSSPITFENRRSSMQSNASSHSDISNDNTTGPISIPLPLLTISAIEKILSHETFKINVLVFTGELFRFDLSYGELVNPFALLRLVYCRMLGIDQGNVDVKVLSEYYWMKTRGITHHPHDNESWEEFGSLHTSHWIDTQVLNVFKGMSLFVLPAVDANRNEFKIEDFPIGFELQDEDSLRLDWNHDIMWDVLHMSLANNNLNTRTNNNNMAIVTLMIQRESYSSVETFASELEMFGDCMDRNLHLGNQKLWQDWLVASLCSFEDERRYGPMDLLPIDHVRIDLLFAEESRFVNSGMYSFELKSLVYLVALQLVLDYDLDLKHTNKKELLRQKVDCLRSVRPSYGIMFRPRNKQFKYHINQLKCKSGFDEELVEEAVDDNLGDVSRRTEPTTAAMTSATKKQVSKLILQEDVMSIMQRQNIRAILVSYGLIHDQDHKTSTHLPDEFDEDDKKASLLFDESFVLQVIAHLVPLHALIKEVCIQVTERLHIDETTLQHDLLMLPSFRYLIKRTYIQYLQTHPLYGHYFADVDILASSVLSSGIAKIAISLQGLYLLDPSTFQGLFYTSLHQIQHLSVEQPLLTFADAIKVIEIVTNNKEVIQIQSKHGYALFRLIENSMFELLGRSREHVLLMKDLSHKDKNDDDVIMSMLIQADYPIDGPVIGHRNPFMLPFGGNECFINRNRFVEELGSIMPIPPYMMNIRPLYGNEFVSASVFGRIKAQKRFTMSKDTELKQSDLFDEKTQLQVLQDRNRLRSTVLGRQRVSDHDLNVSLVEYDMEAVIVPSEAKSAITGISSRKPIQINMPDKSNIMAPLLISSEQTKKSKLPKTKANSTLKKIAQPGNKSFRNFELAIQKLGGNEDLLGKNQGKSKQQSRLKWDEEVLACESSLNVYYDNILDSFHQINITDTNITQEKEEQEEEQVNE